ncbi:hypothetical protein QLX08_003679 [Tetragonisca angustula]|uniref:TPX2 C-terminal domain-containing protein n=1 Tax=Tetragonisca angustula TaxID=166442 RepID=A0AAW1A823_9HYME
MESSSSTNKKQPQTSTPMVYTKDNSKPPRKLWQKNQKLEFENLNLNMYKNSDNDEVWDTIKSPQFVDFTNPPDTSDSFFNKSIAIVSTPNSSIASTENIIVDDNTLVESFGDLSLSSIKSYDANDKTTCTNDELQKEETEEYIVHINNIKLGPEIKICNKVKKAQKTEVYPFTFDLRDQQKQQQKEEHLKKLQEEEKKVRIFRANPMPNFIKSRAKIINNRRSNGQKKNEKNKLTNDKNEPTTSTVNQKVQESDNCDKQSKKNIEVWKKPPFVPSLTKRMLQLPEVSPLHTMIRAQDRKKFDETVKEKERLREETRQMEIAAKKKQEEEEIAMLRKKIVHKARPIPKYKSSLPKVEKRPLTDPVTPQVMKRRRCT